MKFSHKRGKPVTETQLVSLADIAFLIIFFFMFTSQFMRDKIKVPLPWLPKSHQTDSAHSVSMNANKELSFNGIPMENKEALEGAIRTALYGKTDAKWLEVRFKCDRNLTFKDYQPVLEAISNAGGIIAIMHDPAASAAANNSGTSSGTPSSNTPSVQPGAS